MREENKVIDYSCKSGKFSRSAVKHAFNYLSAFSGMRFIENHDKPVIWRGNVSEAPETARVIINSESRKSNNSGAINTAQSNGPVILESDPIEQIIEKISVKVKMGPHAAERIQPNNSIEESLCRIIMNFYKILLKANVISDNTKVSLWPSSHKFCVIVTHDVDMIYRSIPGSLKLLFKKDVPGGVRGLYDSIRSALGLVKNPYDKIQDWIDLENEYGIKSTYFVFAGDRTNNLDPKYGISDLKRSLNLIEQSGHELALHTGIGCNTGKDIKESKTELTNVAQTEIYGMRPHYLSAFAPRYWHSAAENGMQYTSCLGFDEDIGFYNGIDLPFIPFDIEKDSPIDIVEIPIAIMDCGLIGEGEEDYEEIIQKGINFIKGVKDVGGILVLDWHQRTMYNHDYPGWVDVFKGLIDYAQKNGACFCTMEQAAKNLKDKMANIS